MKSLNMRDNQTDGLLITFCGLDGCGKTTIINRLKDELGDKNDLFLTKQPTNFVRNLDIFRNYMDSSEHSDYDYRSLSLLAASDRLQHVCKVIEPEMKKGKIVLSDRYFYSCLANLRARGFKQDEWIYEVAQSVIKPDLAFFFDVPVNTAISRVRSREEEKDRFIDIELQYALRDEYMRICRMNDGILVSTELSFEKSYNIVKHAVSEVINNGNYRKNI